MKKMGLMLIFSLAVSLVQAAGLEVQFGSFQNESLAKQHIAKAKFIGIYDAQIKAMRYQDGKMFYRTVVPVSNRDEADKVSKRLKENDIDSLLMTK